MFAEGSTAKRVLSRRPLYPITFGPGQSGQTKTVDSIVNESPSSASSVIEERQRSPVSSPNRLESTWCFTRIASWSTSSVASAPSRTHHGAAGIDHGGYVNVDAGNSDRNEDSCLVEGSRSGVCKSRSAGREVRWEHRFSRARPLVGNVMDEWPAIGAERAQDSHELPEVSFVGNELPLQQCDPLSPVLFLMLRKPFHIGAMR